MTEPKQLLRDWINPESDVLWNKNEKAHDLLNLEVTKTFSIMDEDDWKPWPGDHKNVMNWCVLITGHAVGFNENPSVGWSFPVKKYF